MTLRRGMWSASKTTRISPRAISAAALSAPDLPPPEPAGPVQHVHVPLAGGERLEQLAGAVGRPVVDEDDLQARARVVQRLEAAHQRVGDECLVVAGDHEADVRAVLQVDLGHAVEVLGCPAHRGGGEGDVAQEEDEEGRG